MVVSCPDSFMPSPPRLLNPVFFLTVATFRTDHIARCFLALSIWAGELVGALQPFNLSAALRLFPPGNDLSLRTFHHPDTSP